MRRIAGFHAIEEALRAGKGGSLLVSGSGPRIKAILEIAARKGIKTTKVPKAELDRLSPDNRGIVLETAAEEEAGAVDLDAFLDSLGPDDPALVLLLDHIEDPQNFGAIVRSADVFACDLVVAPNRRAAPLSESAAKASAGAIAYVPLSLVPNLAEALRRLKKAGFWSYAADMDGEELGKADLPARCALVLGNEGAGVSRILREACDGAVSIPMAGHVDSLNVSAACAVLLYDYRRRFPARKARAKG
jgi:23S rRNA (guanosine2251-2'-O)-methyltransferase